MEVENLQTGQLSDKAVCGCTATSIRLVDDKNHLISATHYDYQSGHLPNIPFKRTCPASSSLTTHEIPSDFPPALFWRLHAFWFSRRSGSSTYERSISITDKACMGWYLWNLLAVALDEAGSHFVLVKHPVNREYDSAQGTGIASYSITEQRRQRDKPRLWGTCRYTTYQLVPCCEASGLCFMSERIMVPCSTASTHRRSGALART